MTSMLKFDQRTLDNMIAALEYSCKKIPPGMDSPALRKKLADAITASAEGGKDSLSELNHAALRALNSVVFGSR